MFNKKAIKEINRNLSAGADIDNELYRMILALGKTLGLECKYKIEKKKLPYKGEEGIKWTEEKLVKEFYWIKENHEPNRNK